MKTKHTKQEQINILLNQNIIREVQDCIRYRGKKKSLADMKRGIQKGAKKHK